MSALVGYEAGVRKGKFIFLFNICYGGTIGFLNYQYIIFENKG